MPVFNFSSTKKDIKKQPNTNYTIINKNIEGVIFINIKGGYYVKIQNVNYNILYSCYNCKNKTNVYLKELDANKQRILYIRLRDNLQELDNRYIPFAPGCCVKGNILKHNSTNTIYFNILSVYTDNENSIANEAIEFYRNNYNEIQENLKK